jgi:hypothetical protein
MKKIASAMMAAALVAATAAPAMAATVKTAPASALSLKNSVRAASPSGKSSKLSAENPAVSVLIAAAAIGGIIVATSLADNGDSADSN